MTSLKITPLVSVIIAFLNEKQFLREAIESVIQQDYNNWELILVDDGSSDESTHIALEYTEKFPEKIRYCEHEGHTNKGLSASRNLGVKHAKGELVAFLDADDIWLSHKLSNQVSIFSLDSSVSMVVESSLYWYSWNDLKSEDVIIYVGADANRVYNPPELMYQLYPLGYGNAPCPSGLMLKHSLFTKVGGFEESFDKQYQLYEDQAFLCKIYLHEKVYISSACHNWYRQRPNSIVKWVKQKGHYHTVRQYFLEYLQNYIKNHDLNYPKVDLLLEQALQPLPLVSVIIAFLNEKQFLREAIESVIQQDYNNWELILVDDGSSDESTHIALEYTEKLPEKIRYCEHEGHTNKGLSASRNLGVKHAKGELVAFLDADDIWLSEKTYSQVAFFRRYPDIGMVAESSMHWYSWNNSQQKDILIPVGTVPDKVYDPYQLLYQLYPLGKGAAPGPCSWLLTKKAITKVGGFEESFDKQYQLYEDQAFLCKIYLHEKVYISSACHNWYRQRPNSIVKWVKQKGHYHTVRQYFLEYLQNYINQQNISNKYLKQLLRKALLPYHHPIIYFITGTVPHMVWRVSKKAIPANIKRFIKSQLANYNSSLKMM